ncbi:MAG: AraC family ligand binding domain-containing protein, partial [Oscillospiraceae bacterium]|nr:AraC family ligand binding domain-containing protein [Oscillospiraceae bacterium]
MPQTRKEYARAGYLQEHYHYFHLRDTAGQELDFHFHEFDKIVLLLEGRVEYAVEDSLYTLEPWTVLLVKHHAIHRASIDRSEPYERIILYLDRQYFDRCLPEARLMDCFEAADRTGRHLLVPDAAQRRTLAD